jgi:hypothetical protein
MPDHDYDRGRFLRDAGLTLAAPQEALQQFAQAVVDVDGFGS